jgi:hypothetical protein
MGAEPVSLTFHSAFEEILYRIWTNGFREDFLEITQSETRITCDGHVS